jgi:hypothetical protein
MHCRIGCVTDRLTKCWEESEMSKCAITGKDLSDHITRVMKPAGCIHQVPKEGKGRKAQKRVATCLQCKNYKED